MNQPFFGQILGDACGGGITTKGQIVALAIFAVGLLFIWRIHKKSRRKTPVKIIIEVFVLLITIFVSYLTWLLIDGFCF